MLKFKYILIIHLLLHSFFTNAQEDAWIYFKDKPNAINFINNPSTILTQRAIDRRLKQNITLDVSDAPLEINYISNIKSAQGVTILAQSKWLNAIHVRGNSSDIINCKTFDFVNKIVFANKQLNRKRNVKSNATTAIVDKLKSIQSTYDYGSSKNQIEMLNGHLLHQNNYTGSDKIIAVLDAGFPGVNTTRAFEQLRTNNKILGGYDFVGRNSDFYTRNAHGTMVLSTIAGKIDGSLVGTAPDASFYLFITEDENDENPLEESLWVEAAEKADSLGVDIINSSLGYFDFVKPEYNYSYSDMNGETAFVSRGADFAFSKGMVVVVSAGNSGNTSDPHIAAPADAKNVLTVGSVDYAKNYSTFSSIGTSFDGRVKPDVMAKGTNATVSDQYGNITAASGTSFSSPITTGLVACLWQAIPWATNTQIVNFIKQSADRFQNPDIYYGYGIPDFKKAFELSLLSVPDLKRNDIFLFPNPSNSIVYIESNFDYNDGNCVLYNNLGQKVLEKNINISNNTISIDNLQSGVYFYQITNGKLSFKGKLIKN